MSKQKPDASYRLLDFGEGKKLEQFGSRRLIRPSRFAKQFSRRKPSEWTGVCDAWEPDSQGNFHWRSSSGNACWMIEFSGLKLELRQTEAGQVGLFPEHFQFWNELKGKELRDKKIINLFGYTGSTTLFLASQGARVTHVDASNSAVKWARTNAGLSGLSDAPVRWIVEDVKKFVAREIKRGNFYDGFIADPPSYGHGPRGEAWKIENDIPNLLTDLHQLVRGQPAIGMVSSHTPGIQSNELATMLRNAFGMACRLRAGEMRIPSESGPPLLSGWFAHAENESSQGTNRCPN